MPVRRRRRLWSSNAPADAGAAVRPWGVRPCRHAQVSSMKMRCSDRARFGHRTNPGAASEYPAGPATPRVGSFLRVISRRLKKRHSVLRQMPFSVSRGLKLGKDHFGLLVDQREDQLSMDLTAHRPAIPAKRLRPKITLPAPPVIPPDRTLCACYEAACRPTE
jgi:hypothetical protein